MSIRIGPDGSIIKEEGGNTPIQATPSRPITPPRPAPVVPPRPIMRQESITSEYERKIDDMLHADVVTATQQLESDHAFGNLEATYLLGRLFFDRIFVAPNYSKSIEYWEYGAARGDINCERGLADCYFYGRGRPEDDSRAYSMYSDIFRRNPQDAISMYMIGRMTAYGWGVSKDPIKAIPIFERAWSAGYAKAADAIGAIYEFVFEQTYDNVMTALKWYQRGVERGDIRSKYHLGRVYVEGYYGVDKDEARGFRYWLEAIDDIDALTALMLYTKDGFLQQSELKFIMDTAERRADYGFSELQMWIGDAYERGRDCEKNNQKAIEWYEKAIANGEYEAAWRLGCDYKHAWNGFEENIELAYKYYRIGADADNDNCLRSLGDLLDDEYIPSLQPGESDRLRKYCLERRAQKGDSWAISRLGTALMNGYSPFKEDKERAIQCFEQLIGDENNDHSLDLVDLYIELRKTNKYSQIVPCLERAEKKYENSDYFLGLINYKYGMIYRDGIGVSRNLELAHNYFLKSHAKGYNDAKEALEHFKKGIFGWKLV